MSESTLSDSIAAVEPTSTDWETELADLLTELSAVQDELLEVLSEKRRTMAACNADAMAQLQPRETQVASRLRQCHQRRRTILARAKAEGRPSASIVKLASAAGPSHGVEQLTVMPPWSTVQAKRRSHEKPPRPSR